MNPPEPVYIPESCREQLESLIGLMERDRSKWVSAKDVAELLGVDVNTIHTIAEAGKLPFGFGGRQSGMHNRITRIPKLALWSWLTQYIDVDRVIQANKGRA